MRSEYVECSCDGWNKNAREEREVWKHYKECTGKEYTGDIIKFCPWCGASLAPKKIERNADVWPNG